MSVLSDERYAEELRGCTAALAAIACPDLTRPVPTCPGWTLRELVTHVGRGHRWAAEIVATRSPEFISPRDVPGGKLPDGQAEQEAWLNASADLVAEKVVVAPEAPVWTFIGSRPARFWVRRRAHEAAVHLLDAQLAAGQEISLAAGFAADGIAEWLELVAANPQAAAALAQARAGRGDGETLHVHATDPGLDGAGEWLVRLGPDGITAEPGHAKAGVAVRGPAARLLAVLTRRLPPSDPAVEVFGDETLLADWLAHTPF
ncbi:MAG: maleylpyruvate isomerase family mycothiol-dependent enzyme [Gemmatimonadota bacterium]